MVANMGRVFCCFLLAMSTHAAAASKWDCSYVLVSVSGVPEMVTPRGHVRFQIDGDEFKRVPDPWIGPKPLVPIPADTFRYKLLENNDVGIVAARSQSRANPDVGPLIGATVVTINKTSGELREGSVMANGEHDLLTGHCVSK